MTELIWEGKYKDGKKVTPVRIALPFQTIETVNESASDRQKRLNSLFNQKQKTNEWRNQLIWGDKKYVLPSLLPEFAGKVNLIYIDPPFDTGADFSFTANIPNHPDTEEDETTSFVKQPSIIEQKAYRDTWGKGLDSYLQWFYETALLLKELLTDDGSIYIHLDWHVGHYAKAVMDEVFGYENFQREIVIEQKEPQLLSASRLLSTTPPFPTSKKVLEAKKTVFNYTPCDNDFELNFAKFLEKAEDIKAFTKLPEQFGFCIQYTDTLANIRNYFPDFIAISDDKTNWIIETKGREDIEVRMKDNAAINWCGIATQLTGENWQYIKVPQKEFEQLHPDNFEELITVINPSTLL